MAKGLRSNNKKALRTVRRCATCRLQSCGARGTLDVSTDGRSQLMPRAALEHTSRGASALHLTASGTRLQAGTPRCMFNLLICLLRKTCRCTRLLMHTSSLGADIQVPEHAACAADGNLCVLVK